MVMEELVIPAWFYPILVWTLVWKGIAMWKSARNNQPAWFVVSLVINTVGLLPIAYIFLFQRNMNFVSKKVVKKSKKKSRRKSFPKL